MSTTIPESVQAPAQAPAEPITTPPTEPTPAQAKAEADAARAAGDDVGALKAESRKWEAQAKANAAAAVKLAEIEEAQKSEAQKATERLAAAEKRAQEAELKATRAEIANTKGVPADLLTGETAEEIIASADKLLAFRGEQKAQAPTAAALSEVEGQPIMADLDAQIAAAQKAHNLPLVIQLTQQRAAEAAKRNKQ